MQLEPSCAEPREGKSEHQADERCGHAIGGQPSSAVKPADAPPRPTYAQAAKTSSTPSPPPGLEPAVAVWREQYEAAHGHPPVPGAVANMLQLLKAYKNLDRDFEWTRAGEQLT